MPRKRPPTPAKNVPVTPPAPVPANVDNKAAHLEKLQKQLNHNASFMRKLGWTVAFFAVLVTLPFIASIVSSLIWPIVKLPFWFLGFADWPFGGAGALTNAATSLIFGTQTTSGVPITLVKAFLPAFMAPAAVFVALGVPMLLFAYQYAYVNWNENLFAPKPSAAALERDRKKGQPDAKKSPEPKQEPDLSNNNKQAPPSVPQPPKTVAGSAVKAAQHGSPILNGFKSRMEAAKAASAKNSNAVKVAPKRAVTKNVISKKAAPRKAAPRKAAPKKAAPKKAAPKKAAPKKAAPKKAAPKKAPKRTVKTPKAAPKKRARRK